MTQASNDPIPTDAAYRRLPETMRAAIGRNYGGPEQVATETLPRWRSACTTASKPTS